MEDIILNYIRSFLGYGNLKNPFWFIGVEEGGGNDLHQAEQRFEHWNERGRCPTEDLVEFQTAIGITQWFEPRPRLQSTWKRLIRIYLRATGLEATTEAIRHFQANCLGRRQAATPSPCVFELMPLPSPGLDEWPYEPLAREHENLAFLDERDI